MRVQLLTVVILIGLIPTIIFSFSVVSNYVGDATKLRIAELQTRGRAIADALISSGFILDQEVEGAAVVETQISNVAEFYNGRILIADNSLQIVKDTYGLEQEKTLISEDIINGLKGKETVRIKKNNQYVELNIPIKNSTEEEVQGVIIISSSTDDIYTIYHNLGQRSVILIITITILVVIFGLWFSNKVTKPFQRVMYSIDHVAEGYMDDTISITGYTEIESIVESFNKMLVRLQKLENSRQEFVSNVSHELKTPITSIKVLSDSLLMQEDAPVELYREFLGDITEEIERENKIINDLLSLVKLDKTVGEMNIVCINVNELLEVILKRLRPIAAKRNIELVFESFRPVIAEVDEVKLSLAISNLVENAIKYNFQDGWVRVSLNADHKFFYIKVTDSGVGIPEDVQENIFERFYRVDKARSRETGGTGLGLSITRNAILMHRGAIKVYSKENEGTTFTVRVPLNYIA